MTKWARIDNGVVVETIQFDPAGLYPDDMVWLGCGEDVTDNWIYDAKKKKFSPPVVPEVIPQPELPPERIGEALDNPEAANTMEAETLNQ